LIYFVQNKGKRLDFVNTVMNIWVVQSLIFLLKYCIIKKILVPQSVLL
jgi:hypothetical protein